LCIFINCAPRISFCLPAWVHSILIHPFYIIRTSPIHISYLHFGLATFLGLATCVGLATFLFGTSTSSSLCNQIIIFVLHSITINHYVISAHYLSFFSAKLFLQHSSPLFSAIESTSALLINKSVLITTQVLLLTSNLCPSRYWGDILICHLSRD